jgi:hypothetical protein
LFEGKKLFFTDHTFLHSSVCAMQFEEIERLPHGVLARIVHDAHTSGSVSAQTIAAAAAAAPAQELTFRFLELPDELRNKIVYEHLLVSDATEGLEDRQLRFRSLQALAVTCSALRTIARLQIWWDAPFRGWHLATVVGPSRKKEEHQLRYDYEEARSSGIGVDLNAWSAAGWLRTGDLVTNQPVVAKWRGKVWYEGKVLALQDDGTVRVKYDDEEEENVPRGLIQPNAPPPRRR